MKDTIVKKIKVLLGIAKQEFASVKLEDGSELVVDSLEVGKEVYDVDGNKIAAGEYVLEDGTKITVDETAVITAITSPKEETTTSSEPVETNPVEETKEEMEEETSTSSETSESVEESPVNVEEKIKELEVAITELYDMILVITEQLKMNETKVTETVEEFKAFKSQPSTQPISFDNKSEDKKMSRFEKLQSLK